MENLEREKNQRGKRPDILKRMSLWQEPLMSSPKRLPLWIGG